MKKFEPSGLTPGDLLLHNGRDDISKLIAWAGGSQYSHAALVHHDFDLREASASGVRRYSLHERLADTTNYAFIDVYRRPAGLGTTQAKQVDAVADHYLKTPYPLSNLAYLGIMCAVRDKIVANKWLRWALRTITDQLVSGDTNFMVCSELVYRSYAEAKVEPSIKPRIVVPETSDLPFPDIDREALYNEWYRDTHPAAASATTALTIPQDIPDVSDALLRESYTKLLANMNANSRLQNHRAMDPPMIEINPNPRTIMPSDLEHSPDFELLGRVTGA
ncbi:MAG: hypothetical protein ACK5UX_04600 [Burkholderiales bacterium]|jgi:hypothetical protein|nr:hypothetical protein [Nitrosomonadaceae bacterium]